ncbi:MAG: phosphopantetheine-binding protein [Nostoc sp. S4]|nr:phosphopantetheine-binding protein [Nostoc sp. S4]
MIDLYKRIANLSPKKLALLQLQLDGQKLSAAEESKQTQKRLVAYIVPINKQAATSIELCGFLKEKLPGYMVPSMIVMLEVLPLLPNGKVNRHALPTPKDFSSDLAVDYVAPRNEVEKMIATIWQEVLQLEKVGMNDNFFDLGGHSLLALQVQSKLQQLFPKNVLITDLFQYPTISYLANYLIQDQSQKVSFQKIRDRAEKQKVAVNRKKQIRQ